jgi:UDP-2,3-diacylglucosamine pyrophosphatase LpxH
VLKFQSNFLQRWWDEEEESDDDDLFFIGDILEGLKRKKRQEDILWIITGSP